MARCTACGSEMIDPAVETCRGNLLVAFPDGTFRSPVPFRADGSDARCGDCNVRAGWRHHVGCDRERCPRCGGQRISCACA